jgi:hypothetical protein
MIDIIYIKIYIFFVTIKEKLFGKKTSSDERDPYDYGDND